MEGDAQSIPAINLMQVGRRQNALARSIDMNNQSNSLHQTNLSLRHSNKSMDRNIRSGKGMKGYLNYNNNQ